MQRREFLKGLLAVGGGIVIPSTKFIFDYGANSYKKFTGDEITNNNPLAPYLSGFMKVRASEDIDMYQAIFIDSNNIASIANSMPGTAPMVVSVAQRSAKKGETLYVPISAYSLKVKCSAVVPPSSVNAHTAWSWSR